MLTNEQIDVIETNERSFPSDPHWHAICAQAREATELREKLAAERERADKLLRDLAGYSDTQTDGVQFCGKCGRAIAYSPTEAEIMTGGKP